MDISDGNLSFVATLDASQLQRTKDAIIKCFVDMGYSAEEAGKRADQAMKTVQAAVEQTAQEVETDAEAMEVLSSTVDELRASMETLSEGDEKEYLEGVAAGLSDVVEQIKEGQSVKSPLEKLSEGSMSAREAMKQMRDELIQMRMAGKENTEEYQRLLESMGKLQDTMSDTQRATKGLASDTAKLDAVLGAANVTAGAFSTVMGAINLVGVGEDTKELAEAQKKLQSVIAITTGLQSLQNALQKESAVMLGIHKIQTLAAARAETIRAAATNKGTIATKAATVAQEAFNIVAKANPYVLLASAILTVIGALAAFTLGSKEQEDQVKKTNEEIAKQVEILKTLNDSYSTLYDSAISLQQRYVDELKIQGAEISKIREAEDELYETKGKQLEQEQELLLKDIAYEGAMQSNMMSNIEKLQAKKEQYYKAVEDGQESLILKYQQEMDEIQALINTDKQRLDVINNFNKRWNAYIVEGKRREAQRKEEDAQREAEEKKRREDAYKRAQEQQKKKIEDEKRYQEELKKSREIAEDLELANGSDNINTRVAKIELENDRKVAEAKEKKKEALLKGQLELADQYERQIVALLKKRDAEINKLYADEEEAQEQMLSDMLDNYKGYEAKKRELEETFAEDIKKLTEKRDEYDVNSAEWVVYNEAVTQAFEAQADALLDLNLEYGKLNQLIKERDRLEKRIALLIQSEDYDEKELENLQKLLAEIQKQIDEINEKTDKATEATKTLADAWKEAAKSIKEADISEQLGSAGSFLEKWSSVEGTKGFSYIGKILGSLGNPAELFNSIADIFIDSYTESIERITAARQKQLEVERMLTQAHYDELNAAQKSMWGEDVLAQLQNQLTLIEEINKKTKEAYAEFYGYDVADLQWKAENLPDWTDLIGQKPQEILDRTLGDIAIKTKKTFLGLADESKKFEDIAKEIGMDLYDEYGNINDEFAQYVLDTYDTLTDEDRALLESLKQNSEAFQEAMEGVASYLQNMFGQVADTIADQFIDSFLEGGQAAMDFGKVTSEVAKKMAKDFIKNLLLTEVFSKYSEQMKEIMLGDGTLEEKQNLLLGYFAAMQADAEKLQPAIQAYLQAMSQFFDTSEEMTTMSGNILGSASQDSVDMVNGQLNAVRVNQLIMSNRLDDVLIQLSGLRTDVNNGFGQSLRHLESIDRNTSEGGSILRNLGIWLG